MTGRDGGANDDDEAPGEDDDERSKLDYVIEAFLELLGLLG